MFSGSRSPQIRTHMVFILYFYLFYFILLTFLPGATSLRLLGQKETKTWKESFQFCFSSVFLLPLPSPPPLFLISFPQDISTQPPTPKTPPPTLPSEQEIKVPPPSFPPSPLPFPSPSPFLLSPFPFPFGFCFPPPSYVSADGYRLRRVRRTQEQSLSDVRDLRLELEVILLFFFDFNLLLFFLLYFKFIISFL